MELMQQALTQKKTSSIYQWYRTHRDQEQQTDRLMETPERQGSAVSEQLNKHQQDLEEEAATIQKDKDALLLEIQQLT